MDTVTVLVLDRDVEVRAEIARLLAERGYVVKESGSAREALATLVERPVECAIVDVELEDMPGLDAIPLLRRKDPQLRVVVTARENTKDLEAKVRRQNVVYYYVKGFEREELVQAVARAIGGRQMGEKAKILVVDDDRDYQAAMRQILETAGYGVVTAYTKEDGLAAVKEADPDLIILDIMMTRTTDGFHFLYEMRADAAGRKPPVLSISVISKETGFSFSPTKDGDYFPADDFLPKPVNPAELLAHVEALLSRRGPTRCDS